MILRWKKVVVFWKGHGRLREIYIARNGASMPPLQRFSSKFWAAPSIPGPTMIHGYLNNIRRKYQTIYHNIEDIEITNTGQEVSGL